jgi:hypothetical protein
MTAVQTGNPDIVRFLIKQGADPRITNVKMIKDKN